MEPLKELSDTPCLSYQTPVIMVDHPGPLTVGCPLIEQSALLMYIPLLINPSMFGVCACVNASGRQPSIPINNNFLFCPFNKETKIRVVKKSVLIFIIIITKSRSTYPNKEDVTA